MFEDYEDYEDYEQDVIDTLDLFIIKQELGEEFYNDIVENISN